MTRLLGIAAVYVVMFLTWVSVGLSMLIGPERFGNLIHDSYGLYPQVHRNDWGKKLILRLIATGLIGSALHFAVRVAALFGQGG